MADVNDSHLRIYCTCGQKMKVLEKMHGLPGKCIACRQKIRIPTSKEIPEGATEIYLKDHPELLRETKPSSKMSSKERQAQRALDAAKPYPKSGEDPTPITELDFEQRTPQPEKRAATLPIDTLDPLQRLSSLKFKLKKQLATLSEYKHDDNTLVAEVEGRIARVAKIRSELDEHLHQLLMEVAIELTNTQENIAQTRLSARVGEIAFDVYQDRVYQLRFRRDRLERRQLNLRGWLATRDPYIAGGMLDLSTENIPEDGFNIELPVIEDETLPLLTAHMTSLKDALARRSLAKQKLEEAEQMAFDGGDESRLKTARRECEAEKRMARTAARFFLGRLERLKKDYANDLETIDAHMEAARDRLKVDAISRTQFDETEQALLRAKKDLAKASSVISRALIANTPGEVPGSGGTFLQRLGFAGEKETKPDMWLGWISAAAICAGLFLPLVGDASIVRAFIQHQSLSALAIWATMVPVGVAIAVALVTVAMPKDLARGLTLLAIWVAATLLTATGLLQAFNSFDPFATQFRLGDPWALRPGIWLMGAGLIGIASAAITALWPFGNLRPLAILTVILGLGATVLIPSDFAGTRAAQPTLDITIAEEASGPARDGSIRIGNTGRRSFHLVSRTTNAKNSYLFVLDRRVGENSWTDVSLDTPPDTGSETPGVIYAVGRGDTYLIPFSLTAGEYRVSLLPGAAQTEIVREFTIDYPGDTGANMDRGNPPPGPRGASNTDTELNEALQSEPQQPLEAIGAAPADLQVELKGIMTGPNGEVRFSFVVITPDGEENKMTLALGTRLWGEWDVSEYNPEFRTVTLQRDERMLILRRGKRIDLPT